MKTTAEMKIEVSNARDCILIEASKLSGFTDYSSFYRTCIIETGHTPKEEYKIYK